MHDHTHAHRHAAPAAPGTGGRPEERRRLAVALALSAVYMLAEVAGGWWTGSLALLADAGHMLTDVAALALSLLALRLAQRPPSAARTYGHHRAEILAALVNGALLVSVAVSIAIEAAERLAAPPEIRAAPMMGIAAGGLVVNVCSLLLLRTGPESSLNLRGAWLHVWSDALGSVGALAAGALILAFEWRFADPAASLLIALLIVRSSWSLLRESVAVLMEGAPGHIDVDEVNAAIRGARGVRATHDLHVWTITSGLVALSCHVEAESAVPAHEVLAELRALLKARFAIEHVTIQIEPEALERCEPGF
jgi:cobalt-zinc-cadmium efflux system protein